VEEEAKPLAAEDRRHLTQERSKPLLKSIEEWMRSQELSVLPKCALGEVFTYARHQSHIPQFEPLISLQLTSHGSADLPDLNGSAIGFCYNAIRRFRGMNLFTPPGVL
jgi:hypothetical protein